MIPLGVMMCTGSNDVLCVLNAWAECYTQANRIIEVRIPLLGSGHYLRVGGPVQIRKSRALKICPPSTTAHSKFAPPRKPCTEISPPPKACQPCIYISRYDVSQWTL